MGINKPPPPYVKVEAKKPLVPMETKAETKVESKDGTIQAGNINKKGIGSSENNQDDSLNIERVKTGKNRPDPRHRSVTKRLNNLELKYKILNKKKGQSNLSISNRLNNLQIKNKRVSKPPTPRNDDTGSGSGNDTGSGSGDGSENPTATQIGTNVTIPSNDDTGSGHVVVASAPPQDIVSPSPSGDSAALMNEYNVRDRNLVSATHVVHDLTTRLKKAKLDEIEAKKAKEKAMKAYKLAKRSERSNPPGSSTKEGSGRGYREVMVRIQAAGSEGDGLETNVTTVDRSGSTAEGAVAQISANIRNQRTVQ